MTYEIGQIVPLDYARKIVSGPEFIDPIWYALTVSPQKERATREYLRARDIFAFYPSEARLRTVRRHAGQTIRREWERPIVSGIIYAQFRQQPQWDVMKSQRRLITGVICRNNTPIAIGAEIIRHLQGLTVEAEKLAQARADILRVRAGDSAVIISGALQGFTVDVRDVRGLTAYLIGPMNARMTADIGTLERVLTKLTD